MKIMEEGGILGAFAVGMGCGIPGRDFVGAGGLRVGPQDVLSPA